jgi:hypothetical protein
MKSMKKIIASVMVVLGVGMVVLAFSHYTPANGSDSAGWPDSCRYLMTAGAMLAAGGKLLF